MVEKGTTMAIGSWERIHVAIGYAAVMYYIATRFYFSEEDLGGTVFGVVSDRCCLFFFSSPLLPSAKRDTLLYIYICVCLVVSATPCACAAATPTIEQRC